jgi:hypothetical protein
MRLLATLLVLGFCCSSSALAEEPQWRWFLASSLANDWILEKGVAQITLTSTSLRADLLWDGVNTARRHRITAVRRGDTFKAKLSTEDTDQVDYPLEGVYQRQTWKGVAGSVGRETITLFAHGIVVGFTRELTK